MAILQIETFWSGLSQTMSPHMDVHANDMTKSGVYCVNDGKEMERVSSEIRYTCHQCGSVLEVLKKDGKLKTIEVIFAGY